MAKTVAIHIKDVKGERRDPPRTGDILHSQADVSLARKHLGYEPLVNYEEGLRRTWEWYKSHPSR